MNPGVYQLPDSDYRAADGINISSLRWMRKSPNHFNFWSQVTEKKKVFDFGTAFHLAILEPEKFNTEVVCKPLFNRRTKQGKAEYEKFLQDNQTKTLIEEKDYTTILSMRHSVNQCQEAKDLLSDTVKERAIFWNSQGILKKGKVDAFNDDMLCDIKTTQDASEMMSQINAKKYGYFHSMAWYEDGLHKLTKKRRDAWIVAVEKIPPFGVGIYEIDRAGLDRALNECYDWVKMLKWCQDKNLWPSYQLGRIFYA